MKNFDIFLKYIERYITRNNDYRVPYDYMTLNGYSLGRMVDYIRFHEGIINNQEKAQLEKIGFKIEQTGRSYKFDFHDVYTRLKNYKQKYGDLRISRDYVEDDGFTLGEKVNQIRNGAIVLTGAQDEDLDNLDFVWEMQETSVKKQTRKVKVNVEKPAAFDFEEYVAHLKEYKNTYGDLFIPSAYKSDDGYLLGGRTANIRHGCKILTIEQKHILDQMDFLWELPADRKHGKRSFDLNKYVSEAEKYISQYGPGIPSDYVTEDGYKLGEKTGYVRRHAPLRKIIEKDYPDFDLNKTIGVQGRPKTNIIESFNDFISHIEIYKKNFGDLNIPITYVAEDGYKLGREVQKIRKDVIKMTQQQKEQLNDMGFSWKTERIQFDFDKFYEELTKYKQEYNNLLIPAKYITQEGYNLGGRVTNLRVGHIKPTSEQLKKINDLGFVWHVDTSFKFEQFYNNLVEYYTENNTVQVPRNFVTQEGYKLGKKVDTIRSGLTRLDETEKQKLTDLGFKWKIKDRVFNFNDFISRIREYKKENNTVKIPAQFVMKDGYRLGKKLYDVKSGQIKSTLEQKLSLEKEGIKFSDKWQEKFDRNFVRNKYEDEEEGVRK